MADVDSVNKKEYLKKYLSNTDKKKKKRKVASALIAKSKVIDDDVDLKKMRPIDDDELEIYDLAEDAPQIAGVIDDRPEEQRITSEYRQTKKWKIVTREYEDIQVSAIKRGVSGRAPDISDGSDEERGKNSPLWKRQTMKQGEHDASPRQKSAGNRRGSDSDVSPARSNGATTRSKNDSDESPIRRNVGKYRQTNTNKSDSDVSPVRKRERRDSDSDVSPPRRTQKNTDNSHHKHYSTHRSESHKVTSKTSHTLEGKKAGLQGADDLKKETAEIRRKQAESLASLSRSASGKGAKAIMRDKHTGKKRDLKEEARQKKQKDEKQAEVDAQYSVWGKGVKQVDDKAAKMKDDLHEMSKPLARYADDADLEERQRNEEYEDDPMIDYIRNKRIKSGKGDKSAPRYQGSFMPNRYNIRPGHKWDGVDRSNGYEKKWFEERNAKKAREEEAFKWSTEDM